MVGRLFLFFAEVTTLPSDLPIVELLICGVIILTTIAKSNATLVGKVTLGIDLQSFPTDLSRTVFVSNVTMHFSMYSCILMGVTAIVELVVRVFLLRPGDDQPNNVATGVGTIL